MSIMYIIEEESEVLNLVKNLPDNHLYFGGDYDKPFFDEEKKSLFSKTKVTRTHYPKYKEQKSVISMGNFGTGKSVCLRNILLLDYLKNKKRTYYFISDYLKGAMDYQEFFLEENVFKDMDKSNYTKNIDALYSIIEARKKTNYKMGEGRRLVWLVEEWNYVNSNMSDKVKKKLSSIFLKGAKYDVIILAASQRMIADCWQQRDNSSVHFMIHQTSTQEMNFCGINNKNVTLKREDKGVSFISNEEMTRHPFINEKVIAEILKKFPKKETEDHKCIASHNYELNKERFFGAFNP